MHSQLIVRLHWYNHKGWYVVTGFQQQDNQCKIYIIRRRKGVMFEITGGIRGSKCKILGTSVARAFLRLLVLVVGYAPAVTKKE
jgi:hypothetical protein